MVVVVRDALPGDWSQAGWDSGILVLSLGCLFFLRQWGYRTTALAVSYGLTVLTIFSQNNLGYHGEHNFFLAVLVLVVVLTVGALFVDRFVHLAVLAGLSGVFLTYHITWALVTGRVTTVAVSLNQQLFIPIIAFLFISLVILMGRVYTDRMNRAYREIARERKARHRSLGQLIRGISHHLNTPLGNAKLILSLPVDLDDPGSLDHRIRLLQSTVEVSIGLVNRLGDFMRYTDQAETECLGADILAGYLCLSRGGSIRTSVSESFLKYYAFPRRHHWDSVRFLVGELVDNARLHSRLPDPVPTVAFDVDTQGGLILKVGSPGTYTGEEVLSRARLPFYSTLISPDHPGLGLYFAAYIVEHVLHGTLDLDSDPEEGTLVTITFPGALAGKNS